MKLNLTWKITQTDGLGVKVVRLFVDETGEAVGRICRYDNDEWTWQHDASEEYDVNSFSEAKEALLVSLGEHLMKFFPDGDIAVKEEGAK